MWPFCGHFQIHIQYIGMGLDRELSPPTTVAVLNQIDCQVFKIEMLEA
jgi:hypothetical protein